jgi:heme exporter protein B
MERLLTLVRATMRPLTFLELTKKDLKVEVRSKSSINQMVLFAIASAFIFSLSVDAEKFFGQILMIVVLFSSMLSCSATVVREFELETVDGLKHSMSSREIIAGKIVSNSLIVFFLVLIITPVCYALFNLSGDFFLLLISLLISSLPISTTVTLLSPLSAFAKGREMLLPAMLFPIIFPVFIPSFKLLGFSYAGIFDFISAMFLLSYTGLIFSLSLILSEHLF